MKNCSGSALESERDMRPREQGRVNFGKEHRVDSLAEEERQNILDRYWYVICYTSESSWILLWLLFSLIFSEVWEARSSAKSEEGEEVWHLNRLTEWINYKECSRISRQHCIKAWEIILVDRNSLGNSIVFDSSQPWNYTAGVGVTKKNSDLWKFKIKYKQQIINMRKVQIII